MAQEIVWTPDNSEMGVGTVLLQLHKKPVTLNDYRWALERKLHRMIQLTGSESARRLLARTVEAFDSLAVTEDLSTAAETMAFESETIGLKTGALSQEWPMKKFPALESEQDRAMVEAQTLEEFLMRVYPEAP